MFNENIFSELQKVNSSLNNKDTFSIDCVVPSNNPVYELPTPINLHGQKNRAALIGFSCDNYFENINEELNNQKFYYSTDKGITWKEIIIASGYYDIDQYNLEIRRQMIEKGDYDKKEEKPYITIAVYLSRYRTVITITNENYMIDFSREGTFRNNLGFENIQIVKGRNVGTKKIQISHVKRIYVHCDFVSGGYDNYGKKTDIILSYSPGEFAPGDLVILRSNIPTFLPIIKDVIDKVTFKITDQFNKIIKSEGEEISFRIQIEQV